MGKKKQKKKKEIEQGKLIWEEGAFPLLNPDAAGIDVGSESMYVCVPFARDEKPVREFYTYTIDLHHLANWLLACQIKTVVMESTGVYWIALYEILDQTGINVCLVNARHVKNLPGRKTDVLDCQWLQRLHSYGLLAPSFIPERDVSVLRSLLRIRDIKVKDCARSIQHMQKALIQMNVLLHNVVSDITGATGLKIIRLILGGEHNPEILAKCRNNNCKKSEPEIAKALHGNYRKEHLLALQQAVEDYDHFQLQIEKCENHIRKHFETFEAVKKASDKIDNKRRKKRSKNEPNFNVAGYLYKILGVDLTEIEGIKSVVAMNLIGEIGIDMSPWKTDKHFSSWLGLCSDNRISGNKVLSTKTRKVPSRAAYLFRMAAYSVSKSKGPLGNYYRRMKAKLGAMEAITALAHKLCRIVYSMIKYKTKYNPKLIEQSETKRIKNQFKYLKKNASKLGYNLVQRKDDQKDQKELEPADSNSQDKVA